jgi:hypothetical protein
VRNSKQIVWSFALAADWVISPIIIESRDRRSFYLFFYNPKDTFTDPFNPLGASPKRSSDMSELSVPGKVRLNVPPLRESTNSSPLLVSSTTHLWSIYLLRQPTETFQWRPGLCTLDVPVPVNRGFRQFNGYFSYSSTQPWWLWVQENTRWTNRG